MAPGTKVRSHCPLCGNQRLKLTLRLRDRNLMTCPDCGVKSTDKVGEPDDIADYYTKVQAHHGKADGDSNAVEEGQGPLTAIARGQADWIEELCGPRRFGSFLEIGCSRGHLLEEMETRGWTVSGIDVSRSSTDEARERCRDATVHCGEPRDAPFPAESFDRMAMYDVLAHLADPVETLREVASYLKPGGLLVLSSTNEAWRLVPWMLRAFALFPNRTADLRDEMYEGQHYCYFSSDNVGRLLAEVGLELVRYRPLQPLSAKYFVHQYSPRRRFALLAMVQLDRVVGSSRKMLVLARKPGRPLVG
jgi:SAM-dependent methyltransferase